MREFGRRVDRDELQHSGAYTLVGGTLHLGSAASKTLLVLCATSPAKVKDLNSLNYNFSFSNSEFKQSK